jgi:hypothetical protein
MELTNYLAWVHSDDPIRIAFRKANDLLEKRAHAHRVARRYGRLAARKREVTAEEAAETAWAELIDHIDGALARLGVHCGNATIN